MISWDGRSAALELDGRRVAVDRVRPDGGDGFEAVLTVRASRVLRLRGEAPMSERVSVDLWAGEPDDSDGLAAVADGDRPVALAAIPLCECGDRGCGNVGLQLWCEVTADELMPLVKLVARLPSAARPANEHTPIWRFAESR
jgi:hypothetical protein